MPDTLRRVRLALRALGRTPTITISAVLILGVGIGMAAAMASVFDAVLLRSLPVRDEDRLVVLWTYRDPAVEFGTLRQDLENVKRSSRTLSDLAGVAHWGAPSAPLLDGDRPIVLNRSLVTGNYFDVLGVRPLLGRMLRAEDELPGAPRVVVLSYTTWRREFGGDRGVVGRTLTDPYQFVHHTIVGVAPPGLDYPAGASIWMPMWPGSEGMPVYAVGRLAPRATPEMARAEFFASRSRLSPELRLAGAQASPFAQVVVGDVRPVLTVLVAAVALLLLVACVNIGNLLLLRAATRARELAIRRALGATLGDLVRQSLLESALLGAAGGALGLLCAQALLRALIAFAPSQLPRADMIEVAGAPLGAALAVTLATIVAFGIVPAMLAARTEDPGSLRLDARSGKATASRRRMLRRLVASQVALALVMLSGAALLARSLARLQGLDLGYRPENLSVLQLSMPAARYGTADRMYPLGEQLMERWRSVPGVTAVTPVLLPPFIGANSFVGRLDVEGQSDADRESNPMVPLEVGGADYFRTMGIPVRRGRGLLDADRENAPLVAVVSESVARRLWPNEDPIGRRIQYWGPDSTSWRTVVGVAGDIHYRSLRDATPTVYLPWRQAYWQMGFAVRSSSPLSAILPPLRRDARAVDGQLAIWHARTMHDMLAAPLAQPRMSTVLMSGFGFVALLLAAIGLYGVMASIVRDQTREIGIRMALGATPQRVRRAVLGDALVVCGAGGAIGVLGALAASRLLARLLFEVSPTDPLALASACGLMLLVALVATYVPARWATRIDPAIALRAE